LAAKTLDEARREIENRIRHRLGRIPVAKLTPKHLDDAHAAWSKEGLGDSSVRRHAAVIRAALSQGVKWGVAGCESRDEGDATAPLERTARKLVTPTPEMVGKLIRVADETDPVMAGGDGAWIRHVVAVESCALSAVCGSFSQFLRPDLENTQLIDR
jgi:hypothetical protein